ncbi:hypothetical protein A3H38_02050 [candidate division WOR-1 bacterium RIFCSPLOWO2_02_FULL_46_20]|uniref:Uncharacterized protein n=2 Tax=Saganbacteria TaxID=1703751 RepID=A0A1F4R8H6_UNCSA|nr:MAG: hypothetical protein A3J44_05560 [candidate division WOR-1 bacterium RIFCSPHIGHO2_02_FULL_45_12]OGC04460.1 MAG: hypothetical protein A3H38_02050 [candidate division WOR-1 bacterium RIFCSPLOWO2_02_FULL_46_20]OGC09612.1 MAG: hypothetical protein A3F86_06425 [candidate division WOR-1 bacterium RIFCSPLOWO2_12_FULL_45_9]
MRLFCLALLSALLINASLAIDISEFEKYQGKEYGPEYFGEIQGTIQGQLLPSAQSILVNGQPVAIGEDSTFSTNIHLTEGQKHLSIETRYNNLRYIKKYLVIRHPEVEGPLNINLSEQEYKNIVREEEREEKENISRKKEAGNKSPTAKKKKAISSMPKKQKTIEKPTPPSSKTKWLGYEFARELAPGKFLVVKRVGAKYFGQIIVTKSNTWIPLHKISSRELKDLLEKELLPPSFTPQNKL